MTRQQDPDDDKRFQRDSARVETGFWPKVRRVLGRVPFLEDAIAAYFCARDPATPFQVKAIAMAALAYFVLPTDVVPDFVAGLGYTDDAAVFLAAWRSVANHVNPDHRRQAQATLVRLQSGQTPED